LYSPGAQDNPRDHRKRGQSLEKRQVFSALGAFRMASALSIAAHNDVCRHCHVGRIIRIITAGRSHQRRSPSSIVPAGRER